MALTESTVDPRCMRGRETPLPFPESPSSASGAAAFAFEAGWSLAAVSVLDAPQRSFCLSRLTTECLATMDANVQRYYREAGAREKQLQDNPVASMLGKRGKHSNAGAVSE